MTALKEWIRTHPDTWLDGLVETYKIDVNEDGGLVSLKYNQLESPMADQVVRQCRGTIVERATGRVLCHPYDKFWNLGEAMADEIDWSTARVQDKLDGSLMQLYEYDRSWRVGSSGHPTAGGSYGLGSERTFRDAFWQVFGGTGMRMPSLNDRGIGFFFELCAPENRIVVAYTEPRLVLHGARYRESGEELSRAFLEEIAAAYCWPIVAEHPLATRDEVLAAVHALDALQCEGFVVVDGQHRRVKVKSPRYVYLHQLRDQRTPRAIIGLWKTGEVSEVLVAFPEYEADVLSVVSKLEAACMLAHEAYIACRELPTRKEYAAAITATRAPWVSLCFRLLDDEQKTGQPQTLSHARAALRKAFDTLSEKILEAAG